MTTLFISDLHLGAARPEKVALFHAFLACVRERAQALYILGDLFELWLGDDDDDPAHREIIAALGATSAAGVTLNFAHGNRDFLCGKRFANETGAALLPDFATVQIAGMSTVVTHGDLLCTRDVKYQRFRRVVRNGVVQALFLATPLGLRQRIARGARRGAQASASRKAPAIMDVEDQTVREVFARTGASLLIHGHTHRPGMHSLEVDDRPCRRVVLGDWYEQDDVLVAGDGPLRSLRIAEFLAGA